MFHILKMKTITSRLQKCQHKTIYIDCVDLIYHHKYVYFIEINLVLWRKKTRRLL